MANKEETLIEHIEALRSVLIKCLVGMGIGFVPIFFLTPYVMNMLISVIMAESDVHLNFFSPMEVFILQPKIALVLDIMICFPYMARQLWQFAAPALYQNERNFIKSIVLTSSGLFMIGVLFCLFLIMPLLIRFGLCFATESIKPVFGIGHVISLALWLSIIFGVMFQFPLVTYALVRTDMVSCQEMQRKRAYIFVGILIVSGILTPPDVISQLMLTLPTYALFEIGLFFGKRQKAADK